MNVNMWKSNCPGKSSKLKSVGYQIIEPASGMLACGYEGVGRLENIKIINKEINKLLTRTFFEGLPAQTRKNYCYGWRND